MQKYKEFRQLMLECAQKPSYRTMEYGEYHINMCNYKTADGEHCIWTMIIWSKTGGIVRGDHIKTADVNDENLQQMFDYLTTGKEYYYEQA